MTTLFNDIRFGFRQLYKSPGFTVAAVLTLAIGIGANIAMFSVVNAVLLRPLPFTHAERLVVAQQHFKTYNFTTGFSYPDLVDWREQNPVFDDVAAYTPARFDLREAQASRKVDGALVSGNFFSLLGVHMTLGRPFTLTDERPDSDLVTIISHDLWRSQYAQTTDVLGQTLTLDGRLYSIIGVLPPGFQYPVALEEAQVWMALNPASQDRDYENRNNLWLSTVGCLKTGVSQAQARSLLNEFHRRIGGNPDSEVHLDNLEGLVVGDVRATLWVLSTIVMFILLVVCANVANLNVAKTSAREREVHIRRALGADRRRLLRQFTTESLILSLSGGLLGVALTLWTTDFFRTTLAGVVPMVKGVSITPWEILFGLGLSLLVGVMLGVAPAWLLQRSGQTRLLNEAKGTHGHYGRFANALIVGQITIALILSIGMGLMIRSMMRIAVTDVGFNQDNLVTFTIDLGSREDPERRRFASDLLVRLSALPYVTGAATDSSMPCSQRANVGPVEVEGYQAPDGRPIMAISHNISPDYFETLRIPVQRGRAILPEEHERKDRIVVISDSLAQRFWSNQDPLDRELNFNGQSYRVVGVVSDIIQGSIKAGRPDHAFFPFDATFHGSDLNVVVRCEAELGRVVREARALLQEMDVGLPLYDVSTFAAQMNSSLRRERFTTAFLSVFAAIALLLIVVGLYGVVSYAVTQRTREIGVRMALGAEKTHILIMVLKHGVTLLAIGSAIGIAGAMGLTRFLSAYIYEVSALDTWTYALVPLIVVAVSLIACAIPAYRAAKIDPMEALRYE